MRRNCLRDGFFAKVGGKGLGLESCSFVFEMCCFSVYFEKIELLNISTIRLLESIGFGIIFHIGT